MRSYRDNLKWKLAQETSQREQVEVDNYKQTVVQADLDLEIDSIVCFMDELIKRQRGDHDAQDLYAFRDLLDIDQERVNELLHRFGIGYSE